MREAQITGLPPVVDRHTRVLILGSMPGAKSLRLGQYYANPANQFWRILGLIMSVDLTSMSYDRRCQAILRAGIGLWDAISACRREGSSDAAIRDETRNDFDVVGQLCPDLRLIAFNGQKAQRCGRSIRWSSVLLPSSSGMHCRITMSQKADAWKAAFGSFMALRPRRSKNTVAKLLKNWKGPYPHRGIFDDRPVGKELI